MSADDDLIPLSHVPREIAALTGQQPPEYRRAYFAVLDGRFPAEQIRGRWNVRRRNLPVVAAALDIPVPAAVAELQAA